MNTKVKALAVRLVWIGAAAALAAIAETLGHSTVLDSTTTAIAVMVIRDLANVAKKEAA